MDTYYTPGQVAERFELSHDTLRYYERIGVLSPVERASTGHRRYRAGDVELLDLVRCLRDTGMPIERMRRFADLVRGGEATIPERIELLSDHDSQLAERIAVLRERQQRIQGKINYYRSVLGPDDD
ncbi:MAG: MerR family transcriptional regulator [Actinocatenispora sp.]